MAIDERGQAASLAGRHELSWKIQIVYPSPISRADSHAERTLVKWFPSLERFHTLFAAHFGFYPTRLLVKTTVYLTLFNFMGSKGRVCGRRLSKQVLNEISLHTLAFHSAREGFLGPHCGHK